jgi:DNA adenine methylase
LKKEEMIILKPFLRWAGGKTWLLKDINNYLPEKFNNYYEPFLGGGSVYIYLKSTGKIQNDAFLSDRNTELINAYNVIKNESSKLIEILKEYKNEKEFYYFLRNQKYSNNIQKAAQFIFLNRTSFNGIYRVNLKGEYNVPFGFKEYKILFDFDNLLKLKDKFQDASFISCDFEETLEKVQKNDLVFLDPPYTVAHENNGFIKYNQKIFAWEDQERLAGYIELIKAKQAYFILTNAVHFNINNLFQKVGAKYILNRYSVIGGKGAKREEISEYIFTNCLK